jgi:hypothetical protein
MPKFKPHLSYAGVAATLALVLAMSGGALAANHYLISSTKQIKPSVLAKLKGKAGKTGAIGLPGLTGKEGPPGKNGNDGKDGAPGKDGTDASTLLASIPSSGGITRSRGLAQIDHTGTGRYVLTWEQDISACYPVANIFGSTGYVVMDGIEKTDELIVETFAASGTQTDEGFYVAVLC